MVLGSRGMVGSACIRELEKQSSVSEIIRVCRDQVDLGDQAATFQYIASERPDWVVVAAAKVGGIYANNNYPADFIYQNLAIQNHVIEGSLRANVENLIFLGSSCIYPKHCPQPIKEEYLLSGPLEPTNEPYALAKIAGIKMCESFNRQHGTDYRSIMPTNLYGAGDNYHPENSHVIPGLIRRFHEANETGVESVIVWGTGTARREFLFVDDLANAIVHVMQLSRTAINSVSDARLSHLNVGTGKEITIADLAYLIRDTVGFRGELVFDKTKPDGTPRKMLDVSKLRSLGWTAKTSLEKGISETYECFI